MSTPEESNNTAAPVQPGFKNIPATLILILLNIIFFVLTYLRAGSADALGYTFTLLEMGAQFNPLTLDNEWYRIFTHMFLHGGLMHLGFNMYALYIVGSEIEQIVGTKKFTVVYFISGVASALNSLYWSMFTIGVGASGAIFGLFGFSLIINIFLSRKHGRSMTPLLINFGVFVGINLLIAKSINADNAAHFGGLAAGLVIGLYSLLMGGGPSFLKVKIEYLLAPLLIAVYFLLPRYQVSYYKFFQQVLAADNLMIQTPPGNSSTQDHQEVLRKSVAEWDKALMMLNQQTSLPPQMASDTAKLRDYILRRKKESESRIFSNDLKSSSVVAGEVSPLKDLDLDYLSLFTLRKGNE